jgi:hypothetical protein
MYSQPAHEYSSVSSWMACLPAPPGGIWCSGYICLALVSKIERKGTKKGAGNGSYSSSVEAVMAMGKLWPGRLEPPPKEAERRSGGGGRGGRGGGVSTKPPRTGGGAIPPRRSVIGDQESDLPSPQRRPRPTTDVRVVRLACARCVCCARARHASRSAGAGDSGRAWGAAGFLLSSASSLFSVLLCPLFSASASGCWLLAASPQAPSRGAGGSTQFSGVVVGPPPVVRKRHQMPSSE